MKILALISRTLKDIKGNGDHKNVYEINYNELAKSVPLIFY